MSHRHATDRKDWTIFVECPNNGDCGPLEEPYPEECEHLTLTAEAKHADVDPREAIPIDECPSCGAELD